MEASRASSAVKALAREHGAAAVRIASAEADAETRARFRRAVARGDLATWSYDGEYADAASDPATLLPGARSIVCIAIPYATPAPRERRGHGRVSAYAWSRDYHRRMQTTLREIASGIDKLAADQNTEPNGNVILSLSKDAPQPPATRVVCDTAPLAERAFAARAGLGWIGKHTSLIVHGLGSAVFLGEIVTTLALEPDPPLRTSCGACTRCVDVCPTGALRGDGTMDATRCISDLTQRRDAIPRELRPLLGTWVWGCDLCNDACPPSRIAGRAGDEAFAPLGDDMARPDLQQLLGLRGRAFARVRETAMGWRGATVLRRNAAVALGNGLDRADVPALAEALCDDPSALVRSHAAWALGRIGSPRAYAALRTAARTETDRAVLGEVALALEPSGPRGAFQPQTL
ncbi:MAG TPA: tRNA epoxyqueuosine(34) reductase QueG [Candidatus Elarobacter sp.]|nr:tRNA epoxyqueuosine(34) reductase QueG [Candidatus Elarobacter sp.]